MRIAGGMLMLAFFIISTEAFAQNKSPLSCAARVDPNLGGTSVICSVLEQGLIINDVVFNRVNCSFASANADQIARSPLFNMSKERYLKEFLKLGVPLKFGDQVQFLAPCNNLLEAEFQTNKNVWTFRFRN